MTRATVRELAERGWDVTLACGSRSDLGDAASASHFFAPAGAAGARIHAVDYTEALIAAQVGVAGAPPASAIPMHSSYEDRPGAEDGIFAALSDEDLEPLVDAWARELTAAGAAGAELLLLHHLTPMHEAAARLFPDVPVITHIHGSELLMLEAIEEDPARWPFGGRWRDRLRLWAGQSAGLIVNDEVGADRAATLLDVPREEIIVIPNGFEPEFHALSIDRAAHWRRQLVERPLGWSPGKAPGSIGYAERDVSFLDSATVLLYVGRFTEVKRLQLLIETFAATEGRFDTPVALVLLGGFPGEWEGEHPAQTAERIGARGIYLAGWHAHAELPMFLAASDILVHASAHEQFGLVLVEAMACEVPPIGVARGGPASIIVDGETGWLIDPDSREGLAAAMVDAVNDPAERERRGAAAAARARELYSWSRIGDELSEHLREVAIAARVEII